MEGLRFGNFILVKKQRLLFRADDTSKKNLLKGKPFELLEFLIENRGKIVSLDEILDGVWGKDVYVQPDSVTANISILRKAINDENHSIIETRSRYGYICNAAVEKIETQTGGTFVEPEPKLPELTDSRKKIKPYLKVIAAVSFILALFVAYVFYKNYKPSPCLTLVVDKENLVGKNMTSVRVYGDPPANTEPFVFAMSLIGTPDYTWWPNITRQSNGDWISDVRLGNNGEKGQFELIAVAVSKEEGAELMTWYNQAHTSGKKSYSQPVSGCASEVMNLSNEP